MRRWIMALLVVLLLMPRVWAEGLDTAPVEELPEEAQALMPDLHPTEQGDFWDSAQEVFFSALGKTESNLRAGLRLCGILLAIATLCAVVQAMGTEKYSAAAGIVGALGMSSALVGTVESMVSLANQTIERLSEYNLCMIPVLSSTTAVSGGTSRATALYAGTMLFSQLLFALITRLLIPATYFYLALATAESALGNQTLSELREFVGWLISKTLRVLLYVFLGYMSVTGVVTGVVDTAALKATKATISGMVPVVGGIISDASESILAGAALLKGSVGVYGMVAILAICLLPFLRIGVQYLLMKLTAAVSGTVAIGCHVNLLKNFASAMGYLLAMCGTGGLLLLISCICLIQGVGG